MAQLHFHRLSVMKQPHSGERHHDTVFVAGLDNVVIPDGAARLSDIGHAGFAGPLYIVAKGEEGVGANRHAGQRSDPRRFFLRGEWFRFDLKGILPCAIGQDVLVFIGEIDINGIVAVGTADVVHKLQAQSLGMLAQPPVIRFVPCQSGTVDAALLSGANADGLSILYIAD